VTRTQYLEIEVPLGTTTLSLQKASAFARTRACVPA
jgi:hypothetical protein